MKPTTEMVSVDKLSVLEKNPRKISTPDFEALKKSIQDNPDYFWVRPCLATTIDGKLTVYAGNQRFLAAKELGLKEVPVIIEENLTKEKMRERIIRDNVQSGEWNVDLLMDGWELKELQDWGVELESMNIDSEVPKEIVEDVVEVGAYERAKSKTQIKMGDVYKLGNHLLMCGDATKSEDVGILMETDKADMILTDPPYNTGMSAKKNSGSTWLNHMFEDNFTAEEYKEFLDKSCLVMDAFVKTDSVVYVFMGWKNNHVFVQSAQKRFVISNIVVWDKVVHGLGSDYQYTYELINVCKKGKPKISTHQRDEYKDIWHVQREMGKNEEHATAKPIKLLDIPLRHASKEGDIVLDLFGGSGSTLIACEQLDRKCRMMEIDPVYCQIIIDRYEKFSGKKSEKVVYNE